MRIQASFLSLAIMVAVVGAAIGAVMIVRSGDDSTPGDDIGAVAVARGPTPAASSLPQTGNNTMATGAPYAQSLQSDSQPIPAPGAPPAGVGGAGGGVGGAGNAGASGGGPAGVPGSSDASALIDRKIERQSTLDITVEDVTNTVTRIQAAATAAGGYTSQAGISQQTVKGPDGEDVKRQQATVQIRVPSDQYETVMSGLRGLAADVTSENSQTTEVTAEYTDLQSQLRNLQATEQQYLGLMAQAATVTDILTVSDRLNGVQAQIEQIQGRINLLDNLSDLATITVNVTLPPLAAPEPPKPAEEPNWARQALDDAWQASEDVLQFMGVAAITAGVVMVWVLVPGVLLLAGWRLFGGRKGGGQATSA
jgi:hypothetical protein